MLRLAINFGETPIFSFTMPMERDREWGGGDEERKNDRPKREGNKSKCVCVGVQEESQWHDRSPNMKQASR
jgi:hypothetical protein